MAASKLFSSLLLGGGPSIIRTSTNLPSTLFQTNKTFLKQFRRCSFSALPNESHPWPEWVNFLDQLKSKGYLTDDSALSALELNVVKEACLSFARHRFDIFRSLQAQDIQTVVQHGCPNILRKAVNSAKRLRAYVELDESDVCSSCSLRGSCDRAYVMLSEAEAAPRTVDIVRIVLIYALDQISVSGGKKLAGGDVVEASVRKLLLKLAELCETVPDPEFPQPAAVTSTKKRNDHNVSNTQISNNDEMKTGDWVCNECKFMNFARNFKCLRCNGAGPNRISGRDHEKKIGDWDCPQCSFMNFSSNRQCFRCSVLRPKRELRPGDWECSKCDFVNFSRNTTCKKCNHEKPRSSIVESASMAWNRPY